MGGVDRFEFARQQMVAEQIRGRRIMDADVLAVMERIPRELFVAADQLEQAYADCALPIDCGQTISQPLIVAMMSEALELNGTQHVLEIGTGSGYQTAVLANLAATVVSIERHRQLSLVAQSRLEKLQCKNVTLIVGDGTQGWVDAAPYDRIIVTAAATGTPDALWNQLCDQGLLVIPIGDSSGQMLKRIRRNGADAFAEDMTGCRFVPLIDRTNSQHEIAEG